MAATPYFVADSASVTVLRSLASTAFGKYILKLPDGVDLEDVYEVAAPGNELAYAASLGTRRRVGGMFRRFIRADVNVTAQGEDMVPASDVERVLNDAEKRVSGDFFLESDITRAGLGPWTPFVDFNVGDIANVEIWGRVVPLAVTRIEPKRTDHSDNDWSVHVGGQLLSDSESRLAENADIYNAVVSDRRDLAGLDGKIRTETNNRKAAVSAERKARVADVSQVREILGGARADERSLVSQLAAVQAQIAGMVGDGESPPPPGMLNSYLWMNTRLWQQQDEINRLNSKFQKEQKRVSSANSAALHAQDLVIQGMPRMVHIDEGRASMWSGSEGTLSYGGDLANFYFSSNIGGGAINFEARGKWTGAVWVMAVTRNGDTDVKAATITSSDRFFNMKPNNLGGYYKAATAWIFPDVKK